ncbi:MAG: STAS domain-containing protein [Anaerolineales bacterium]|nr:STAS domain-containing protein [Anaerolineales bacterium]
MMQINVSQEQGNVPVSVISVAGQLDGQTYQQLIDFARDVKKGGATNLLLDLSELTYISSAGLVALHSIALLMRGEELPDPEQGWNALKSVDRSRTSGLQKHVKLLNPTPQVLNVLDMVGYTSIFEVLTDKQKAVESF